MKIAPTLLALALALHASPTKSTASLRQQEKTEEETAGLADHSSPE